MSESATPPIAKKEYREPKDKLQCSCSSKCFFVGMEGGRAVSINCVVCLLERKLRPS